MYVLLLLRYGGQDDRVPRGCIAGCTALTYMEDKDIDRASICSRK